MRVFPATNAGAPRAQVFSRAARVKKVVLWVQIQVLIDANANLIQKAKANEKKDATAHNQTNIQVALCRCPSLRCMCQRTHELKRARQSWAGEVRERRKDSGERRAKGG
jgi:hypothetical protein